MIITNYLSIKIHPYTKNSQLCLNIDKNENVSSFPIIVN